MNALLTLCAAVMVLAGEPKGAVKVVNGEAVRLVRAIVAKPMADIRDLKMYACRKVKDDERCTVITGTFISRMANEELRFLIEIDLAHEGGRLTGPCGTARADVNHPKMGQAVRFTAIGPSSSEDADDGSEGLTVYSVRITIPSHPVGIRFGPQGGGKVKIERH